MDENTRTLLWGFLSKQRMSPKRAAVFLCPDFTSYIRPLQAPFPHRKTASGKDGFSLFISVSEDQPASHASLSSNL